MRPYLLSETNWRFVKQNKYQLAVLPWGATEAHNYHLPYGTDNFQVEKVAEQSAEYAWNKGANLVVLPPIHYGVNTGQLDIPLCMNVNPSTQYSILKDIVQVLNTHRIHKLVILNGHGGNDFKPMVRELGALYPSMFIATCNWFQSVDLKQFFENPGDHADEMETSLMMHLYPNLVLPLSKAGEGRSRKFTINALNSNWAWAEREWTKVSDDTGTGNPKKASPEKGERYMHEVVKQCGEFLFALSTLDKESMYC